MAVASVVAGASAAAGLRPEAGVWLGEAEWDLAAALVSRQVRESVPSASARPERSGVHWDSTDRPESSVQNQRGHLHRDRRRVPRPRSLAHRCRNVLCRNHHSLGQCRPSPPSPFRPPRPDRSQTYLRWWIQPTRRRRRCSQPPLVGSRVRLGGQAARGARKTDAVAARRAAEQMGDNQGDDQRGGDGGCHHQPRAVTLLPEPAHAGGEVDFEAGHEKGVMGTILLRCCLSADPCQMP